MKAWCQASAFTNPNLDDVACYANDNTLFMGINYGLESFRMDTQLVIKVHYTP